RVSRSSVSRRAGGSAHRAIDAQATVNSNAAGMPAFALMQTSPFLGETASPAAESPRGGTSARIVLLILRTERLPELNEIAVLPVLRVRRSGPADLPIPARRVRLRARLI